MGEEIRNMADTELMELVKCGDFSAFDELYNRYSGPLRRFLFSLTWDQDTAEDYLQEVFLRLYRARDRYLPTGKFSTYIFQIAKNYYLAQCRKMKKSAKDVSLSGPGESSGVTFENIHANPRIEPETHLLEEYRRLRIRRAVLALPEAQRLVFVMSHYQEMKYTEIAEVLGIPLGTVKSRMFTAVNTLRSALKEENL